MTDDYYARGRQTKALIEAELGPALFRISYCGHILGGITIIWYWGKTETSFAHGKSLEQVIENAERQVFRGL